MSWVLAQKRPKYAYGWEDAQPYRYFAEYPAKVNTYDLLKAVKFRSRREAIAVRDGLSRIRHLGYVARRLPEWL